MLTDESDRRKIITEINNLSNKVSQEVYNERIKQVITCVNESTGVDLTNILLLKKHKESSTV
jgi:hypothetical protein